MGVIGVGGAGDGLDQAVHGDGRVIEGDHAVGGQGSQRLLQLRWVGQAVQDAAGDRLGAVPGQDAQLVSGQRRVGEPVHGEAPDAGDGAFGVIAFGGLVVHHCRIFGEQVQVGAGSQPGLVQIRRGLLDGQRQVAQLAYQLDRPVQSFKRLRAGGGDVLAGGGDPGEQLQRLRLLQHVQP
ncbi:hypothetical protein ACIBO5_39295 [Nonomuraea angiospora]|uniref:hypothetical protein n=1 Tax=Nonomuraea angiospora TaxID=46172 RepID=UPI0037BC0B9D